METKEIPILLLTGYLGSGKTTLLNYLLSNREGIKFAVIVNDIGEINIDAELIQKDGIVGQKEESLVALQNGCICCTLRTDLIEQIFELMKMQRFDYIVIEASGVCEPEPIAQTICSIPQLGGAYTKYGTCRLDNIVTVVDALRLQSEFDGGNELTRKDLEEEDIANLLIQQIEFCTTVLLNKVSEVTPEERERIKSIIRTLQPRAEIIECDYAKVDLDKIVGTRRFDYARVATSAGWIREIERPVSEEEAHPHHETHEHHEEHEHHHEEEHNHAHAHEHSHEGCHHHHHHADEVFTSWGVETPKTFTMDELKADLAALDDVEKYGAVLRAKGIVPATDGGWIHFDYVPGESDVRRGSAQVTGRVCVIGSHLAEDALKELFHIG